MKLPSLFPTAFALLLTTTMTQADEGRHMVSAGWLHIDTRPESTPLRTTSLRNGASTTDTGTAFSVEDMDTAALTYAYAFSDNLSGMILSGIPPEIELTGSGTSSMVGNLSRYGSLAKATVLSPTLIAQYTFRSPAVAFRPFAGLGVSYTRFSDVEMNPALEQAFIDAVKTRTSGAALDVAVRIETEDSWSVVALLGTDYRISPKWHIVASLAYLPLETDATVTTNVTRSANPALLPTGDFSRSESSMDINPIVSFLGIGYRF